MSTGQFHVTMDMVEKNTSFSAHFVFVSSLVDIFCQEDPKESLDWNKMSHLEQLSDNFFFLPQNSLLVWP